MTGGRALLRELKAATADLHAEAECYVRILDATALPEDYARYLRAMHGFHAPLERAFAEHAGLTAVHFDAAARRKSHLARRDLAALGDTARTPECPGVPELAARMDLPTALGVAYVLEGSTLGGRFVLARLPPVLAALRGRATAFLDGYGDQTGLRWLAFGALVEGHGAADPAALVDYDVAADSRRRSGDVAIDIEITVEDEYRST